MNIVMPPSARARPFQGSSLKEWWFTAGILEGSETSGEETYSWQTQSNPVGQTLFWFFIYRIKVRGRGPVAFRYLFTASVRQFT